MKSAKKQSWTFDRDAFWRAIKGRMQAEGLDFRSAAAQIGVGHTTLWRIERHMPDVGNVVRICQWLQTTVDSFVVGKGAAK